MIGLNKGKEKEKHIISKCYNKDKPRSLTKVKLVTERVVLYLFWFKNSQYEYFYNYSVQLLKTRKSSIFSLNASGIRCIFSGYGHFYMF